MTRLNYKSVALDGPSGAGKSTMAKRLAATLGFLYVDTGAIYRTLGLFVLKSGASPGEWGEVEPLLPKVSLRMAYGEDGRQHMYLGDEDVTEAIRQPEVSDAASKISAIPEVRAFLRRGTFRYDRLSQWEIPYERRSPYRAPPLKWVQSQCFLRALYTVS